MGLKNRISRARVEIKNFERLYQYGINRRFNMKIRKAFLSIVLSVAVLIMSQPVFAVQNQSYESSQKSGTKASFEVLSQETEPLTLNDLKKHTKATLSNLITDSSDSDLIGKTKFKEKPNTKSNSDSIKDSGSVSVKANSVSATAAGPDLVIGNLAVTATQPFSYTAYTNFNMLIANIGKQSISNVTVRVFVDNTQILVENMGDFAAGFGGTLTVPLKGLCGSHQVKFTIAGDTGETNTSNNFCASNFTWQNVIDLAAETPEQVNDPIYCSEKNPIKVSISNYGNLLATNAPVNFELAGKNAGSTSLNIPAMTRKTLTLQVTFICGSGLLGVKVDNNNTINDADRSNNYALKQFKVIPEDGSLIGKYTDAANMKIAIAPSAHDLLDGSGNHISFGDADTAISKWNGITSKCRVAFVANVLSETPDGYDVVLRSFPGDEGDAIAMTSTNFEGLRTMELSLYYFNGYSSTIGKKELKRTLTHETGHVFGLNHPLCNSKAIMHQSTLLKDGIASYDIEPHDSNSLKYLYS